MPKLFFPILFLCFVVFLVYILKFKTVTTMKFFPIDEVVTIEQANTNLTMENDDDIIWNIRSKSSEQAFLRQDVSLLYENGKFKGVHNQWKQNVAELDAEHSFQFSNNSRLEAISFHHAEVHRSNDEITSAQKMTSDRLYVMKENKSYNSFKKPQNDKESMWSDKLDHITEQQLKFYWNRLLDHFQIKRKDYDLIPLTELYHYDEHNFPNHDRNETDEILGKLWEGLYKNYILLLRENEYRVHEHYVPLILLAKDGSHLLVIFELNGEKQQLIQKIRTEST